MIQLNDENRRYNRSISSEAQLCSFATECTAVRLHWSHLPHIFGWICSIVKDVIIQQFFILNISDSTDFTINVRGIQKETSRSPECANLWQYRCVCNKEWFRQERGSTLPAARGSRVQVIRPTQPRHSCRSSSGRFSVIHHTVQTSLPAIYGIFGPLKKALRGKRFTSNDDVKQYLRNWFTTQPREFYETAIHRLVLQWGKCLNNQGQYFWHTVTGFCS